MLRLVMLLFTLSASWGLGGCDTGPKSAAGFRLPDGDAARGERSFLALGCHSCHTMAGVELPKPIIPGPVRLGLGGEVTRVKTYGELVSSIINPSHRIKPNAGPGATTADGESVMRVYNDVMTIQQLIDLVAFLQSHYKVVPPPHSYYAP